MAVEHGHRAEPLQHRQRLGAVVGAPAPLLVDDPQRHVGEHHHRLARRTARKVLLQPAQLVGPQVAHAAALELLDVHQADEVHAGVVEAVPAVAQGSLAVAVQEGLALPLVEQVVLAGNMERLEPRLAQDLVRVVEFLRLGELGDVAGVDDEIGLHRHGPDLGHRLAERRPRVGVRILVEADVAVAHLQEGEGLHLAAGAAPRRSQGLVERNRGGQAPADRPEHSRARPGHAFEETATVGALGHWGCPAGC